MKYEFDVVIYQEDAIYVAYAPGLDIASQGHAVENARDNLHEAVSLWLETASRSEIESRLPTSKKQRTRAYLTQIEVSYGKSARVVGAGCL